MTKQEYLNSLSEEEKKRYYKIAMLVAKKKKDLAKCHKWASEAKISCKIYRKSLPKVIEEICDKSEGEFYVPLK